MADLLAMPSLPLDVNGYPHGHYDGLDVAAQSLQRHLNNILPTFISEQDARDCFEVAQVAYWAWVKRQQPRRVTAVCCACGRVFDVVDACADEDLSDAICGHCWYERDEAQRDAALEKRWEEETGR